MTDAIEFVDRMTVEYVQHMGSDATVVNSARVSTGGAAITELTAKDFGLIDRLVGSGHTSTLEHCVLTVKADVTLDVRSEWHRHRTQSFNEISGRYSEYQPRFYIEPKGRPLGQVGKSMDYRREHLGTGDSFNHRVRARQFSDIAWTTYLEELESGVCREVARRRLPTNLMTQFYATANLNNWFRFLELRNSPEAIFEIRDAAFQVEQIIAKYYPITYEAYSRHREENK